MKMTLMEFRRLVRMEITKFASQLSTALKEVSGRLRQAPNLLTRMGRVSQTNLEEHRRHFAQGGMNCGSY